MYEGNVKSRKKIQLEICWVSFHSFRDSQLATDILVWCTLGELFLLLIVLIFFSTGHKLSFPGHFLNIKRKLYCLRHLLWRDRHCWRRPLSIPCHQDDGCRPFLLGKSPETQPVVVSSGRLIPLWQVNICHFVFWASPVVFNCLVWVWVFFVYEFGFRFYGVDFCSVIR